MKYVLLLTLIFSCFSVTAQAQLLELQRLGAYQSNNQGGYDVDAQAFMDAVGTLTVTEKDAINDLVVGFKANGTWNKYHAIYPMIGGTASEHKWNLKDPRDLDAAYRLTFHGGLIHSEFGVQGNDTDGWANTWFADTNWVIDENNYVGLHMGYYSNLDIAKGTGTDVEMGAWGGGSSKSAFLCVSDGGPGRIFGSAFTTGFITDSSSNINTGYVVFSSDNGTVGVYRNGSIVKTQAQATRTSTSGILVAINAEGTSTDGTTIYSNSPTNRRCAFATIGDGNFTSTDIANDYTVIQAYQTALGRQN